MIYDLEISDLFIKELKNIYKIEDNEKLYKYLMCRFICSNFNKFKDIKRNISTLISNIEYKKSLIDYFLNELDLIINEDYFLYKDVPISIYGSGENTIFSIISEIESNCIDLFFKDDIYKEIIFITTKSLNSSKRKCSNKKDSEYYEYYLTYYSLKHLNKYFNIGSTRDSSINENLNFKYIQYMPSLRIEDKCERYIVSELNSNDCMRISEDVLEKFLYKKLHLIEEGLTPIKRQFAIKDGRIDILAKDKNGVYTIIELKVEKDTDLIYQCVYYSTQFKLEKKISNVRVITISPEYEYGLLTSLKEISNSFNVESYICSIKSIGMDGNNIDSLKLIKVI